MHALNISLYLQTLAKSNNYYIIMIDIFINFSIATLFFVVIICIPLSRSA